MMNCSWTRHLVLPRTRKVWFMIASEFTVRKQYRGNYRHLRISVIQINDHITQRARPDPAELHSLTACFETLINSWQSYNSAQWWEERKNPTSVRPPASIAQPSRNHRGYFSSVTAARSALSAVVQRWSGESLRATASTLLLISNAIHHGAVHFLPLFLYYQIYWGWNEGKRERASGICQNHEQDGKPIKGLLLTITATERTAV